jgi:hypothetical protein
MVENTATATSMVSSARSRAGLAGPVPAGSERCNDAIDHLLDGNVSPEERRDYLDVSYTQPQLEQIRRATLKLVKQHSAGVPEDYRTQIKRWTAGIRASAVSRE